MENKQTSTMMILLVCTAMLLTACGGGTTPASKNDAPPAPPEIVSTDFADFGATYCDTNSTSLKKKALFEDNFKDRYVTWAGTVSSIRESSGKYILGVKHCDDTWTEDIDIKMRPDQKDALLDLKEGDQVTYTAKMKSIGGLLTGLGAEDGVILS